MVFFKTTFLKFKVYRFRTVDELRSLGLYSDVVIMGRIEVSLYIGSNSNMLKISANYSPSTKNYINVKCQPNITEMYSTKCSVYSFRAPWFKPGTIVCFSFTISSFIRSHYQQCVIVREPLTTLMDIHVKQRNVQERNTQYITIFV